MFYLPSYSPELNPDERLNAELKHVIGSRVPARTKDKLRIVTNEHMAQWSASPSVSAPTSATLESSMRPETI